MKTLQVKKDDAVLVVIDFQEKLLPAMHHAETLEETVVRLVKGCRVMGTDIIVTQQYTKGLGATTPKIHAALTEELFEGSVAPATYEPIDKTFFSAMKNEDFVKELKATGKKTVILCGIEAHICTLQTCMDLLDDGYNVFVVSDCVSSRDKENKKQSVKRMVEAGAIGTTYEAVLYEMLGGAKAPEFKMVSKIVK